MKTYVAIDGDDIGRRITAYYLANNPEGLSNFSKRLNEAVASIAAMLESHGFCLLFDAADGVTAYSDSPTDVRSIFDEVRLHYFDGMTFSMGVGLTMREAYIALLAAKCNGKARYFSYTDLPPQDAA